MHRTWKVAEERVGPSVSIAACLEFTAGGRNTASGTVFPRLKLRRQPKTLWMTKGLKLGDKANSGSSTVMRDGS